MARVLETCFLGALAPHDAGSNFKSPAARVDDELHARLAAAIERAAGAQAVPVGLRRLPDREKLAHRSGPHLLSLHDDHEGLCRSLSAALQKIHADTDAADMLESDVVLQFELLNWQFTSPQLGFVGLIGAPRSRSPMCLKPGFGNHAGAAAAVSRRRFLAEWKR